MVIMRCNYSRFYDYGEMCNVPSRSPIMQRNFVTEMHILVDAWKNSFPCYSIQKLSFWNFPVKWAKINFSFYRAVHWYRVNSSLCLFFRKTNGLQLVYITQEQNTKHILQIPYMLEDVIRKQELFKQLNK